MGIIKEVMVVWNFEVFRFEKYVKNIIYGGIFLKEFEVVFNN